MHSKRIFILALVGAVLLAACGTARAPRVTYATAWQQADLRALEAPNTTDPAHDLVAAYARLTQTDLEIRVDFLGSPDPFDYDLTLALDDLANTGGGALPVQTDSDIAWDLVETFPARGLPRAFTPGGAPAPIRPRILRDSVLDSAVIRLSRRDLPQDLRGAVFRVFVTRPDETLPIDSIGARVSSQDAVGQAAAYLAFWDALPAATPAQALRRWDGAHTGPLGQRHGLSVLLEQAAANGIPLAVLDLKRPDRLAALDALGGLPRLRGMIKNGLLEVPDLVYGDPQAASSSLSVTRRAASDFQLPGSAFFYGSTSILPGEAKAAFTRLKDTSRLVRWNGFRLIPLPGDAETSDGEGLTLAARQALLAAALSGDTGRVVPLGGPLPSSAWGDSTTGALAFRYLAGHPWIHVVGTDDLLDLAAPEGAPDCADLLCLSAQSQPEDAAVRGALQKSPPGLFTDLAWQAYLALTDPTADAALRRLRTGYLGDIAPLLEAARWNAAPRAEARCDVAAPGNTRPETPLCVLASQNIFLVLDPLGGRLVLAAAKDTQLAGPRSQFAVGLSDPLDWKPDLGPAGDPQEIPGAFADLGSGSLSGAYRPYTPEIRPGAVTLSLPGGPRKTYRLTETGFQAQIESAEPVQTRLPIALIDSRVYAPGGFARYQAGAATWSLGTAQVRLSPQGATFSAQASNESLPQLRSPEDPDTGYPPGHFIPFPLAVYAIEADGNFILSLDFKK